MYKYDQYDQQMVDTRVAEFRDQVKRRLAGDLTEEEFNNLTASQVVIHPFPPLPDGS